MVGAPAEEFLSIYAALDILVLEFQFLEFFSKRLQFCSKGFEALFCFLFLCGVELCFEEVLVRIEGSREGGQGSRDLAEKGGR